MLYIWAIHVLFGQQRPRECVKKERTRKRERQTIREYNKIILFYPHTHTYTTVYSTLFTPKQTKIERISTTKR